MSERRLRSAPPPGGEGGRYRDEWWAARRSELVELMEGRSAAYVYDLDTVRARATAIASLESLDRVFYAMKANPHPAIIRELTDQGLGLECVSVGELEHTHRSLEARAWQPSRVLFTPNFAERREYEVAYELGAWVTVDALHPLTHWPEVFEGREVVLRLDVGAGRGHHEMVRTGGPGAKFGIPEASLGLAVSAAKAAGAVVVGLHAHSGSGILDPDHWQYNAERLVDLSRSLPDLRIVDLGGGLGVPDRWGGAKLDLSALDRAVGRVRRRIDDVELWLEPGRYLVADAGVLLARVTQTKEKGERRFVGVATGMNSLIRPALYGAYHEVVNLSRLGNPETELVTVVGPICESGDRLAMDRLLPPTQEGDVILVAQAGAYGRVMSSSYNLRPPADEIALA